MRNIGKWILFVLTAACCVAFGLYYFLFPGRKLDSVSPQIIVPEGILEASVNAEQEALLEGMTANDDRDGNVTTSLVVEDVSDIYDGCFATVTCAAFDSAGNVSKAQRTVKYTDYESPRFSLSAPFLFSEGSYFDVFDVIRATDAIDGELDDHIKGTLISGETAIEGAGEYEVEFRVTNSLGDTVYLPVTVEVCPVGTYSGFLELTDYLVYLEKGDHFDPKDYLVGSSLGIRITSDVVTGEPGVYEVTYTGNSHKTRLIVVVEE